MYNPYSSRIISRVLKILTKDRVTDEIETGRIQAAASSCLESLEISGIHFDCGLNPDELGYISRSGIQELRLPSNIKVSSTTHEY